MSTCKVCGATLRSGSKFCTKCGTKVTIAMEEVKHDAERICQHCGETISNPAAEFCRRCGHKLSVSKPKPAPTPKPTPAPQPGNLRVCPYCGFDQIPPEANFCKVCGKELPKQAKGFYRPGDLS